MGPYLGGLLQQKLGLVKPWPDQSDLGRFTVTSQDGDTLFFKVPVLRNVAETGPYFHNGSVATLPEAVSLMAEYQLGRTLDDATVASIVAFLEALTGEVPAAYIAEPVLPASTVSTPLPDPS
jgi:cytochrome c peroxidase